jgi:HAMP domain-containing protein
VLLGRLRIRGKLALLVTIPLLAVVALTIPVVLDRVDEASKARSTADAVRVAGSVGVLLQDLQQERFLSIAYVAKAIDREKLTAQIGKVDQRLADVRAGKLPQAVTDALTMSEVTELREAVRGGTASADKVLLGYTAATSRLISALRLEQGADVTTSTGRQVVALDAVIRMGETISAGITYLLAITDTKNPALIVPFYANNANLQLWANRMQTFATVAQTNLYNQLIEEMQAKLGRSFADPLAVDPLHALDGIPLALAVPAFQSVIGVGLGAENQIVSDVTKAVNEQERRALTTAYGVGGLSLLVLLGAVFLSAAVARAVARPLTRLTQSADRVARVAEAELVRVADDEADTTAAIHLDSIDVGGRDEIGDLARAFERVQGTASGLVERQVASRRNFAQMFGHVGRRTQNLVARQVALIDRLESQETDPDRLQHLYRLDHVSSRLRRNAGSLVVLSGGAGVDEQMSPLPLADVVRLALGEIEDYTRVDVHVPTEITLVPSVINDLVLVLAELMENATGFSPPHVRVTVSAQATSYGVQLAVVDHGLGLSEERLEQENSRLQRRERLDLAPTEVLGLFVVGRLSRRHDLGVTLAATPGGGVTATMRIDQRYLAQPVGVISAPAPSAVPAPMPILPAPVGRATVPAAAAPMAAPAAAAQPGTIAVRLPAQYFDQAAVERASRSIAATKPWSAFAPRRTESPEGLPWPPKPAEADEGRAPVLGAQALLRRRVPGSHLPQLPGGTAGPAAAPPQPTDAATVKALVEDFEFGVLRAEREERVRQTSTSAAPPLTRRVPGVTLEALQQSNLAPRPAVSEAPPDPDEARKLVEQFEAGVTRALREVRTDHQHEEGIPR